MSSGVLNSIGHFYVGYRMANEFVARKGLIVSGSTLLTGSLNVSNGITGSLFGTSSWADNAISSSFATTASFAISSSRSVSASFTTTALSASYFSGSVQVTGLAQFPSGVDITGSLLFSNGGVTGSVFGTSSLAVSSSFAISASWAPGGAGTVGPGTVNSLALFDASSTISSSNIFQSSSNIGINTTTPNRTLSVNGSANITGSLDVTAAFTAQTKSFKILHQGKPGKSLIYGVLEGPEHAVYARGRLTNTQVIILPEEWEWLVDETSITVQLTPVGKFQTLYVEVIEDNCVIIRNMSDNTDIDCYYLIHATRKDVEPLNTVI